MAISERDYNEYQKDQSGLLDIGVKSYYFQKLRPYMKDMLAKCRTDGELIRTIEKVINAADSFCNDQNYQDLSDSFDVLQEAITDKNYFYGVMRKAPEKEKSMVRNLIEKINDLKMIIKCEPPVEKKEEKIKERLNYNNSSPIGENKDYIEHNMKNLNAPINQKRIPNT